MTASSPHLTNHPTLVLVCKRPALGHGKQRLALQIGAERALELAECLLDCALEDLRSWHGSAVIAPDREDASGWANQRAPQALCIAQGTGNLGKRLNGLDSALRNLGHQRLIFIGSDAPALVSSDYQRVLEALTDHDTALLNARDGGVVIMASNRFWPDLTTLPWSTAELGNALADVCRQAGHTVAFCGESFDIDEHSDLTIAMRALEKDPRSARRRLLQALNDPGGSPA